MKLEIAIETWPLKASLAIAGYGFDAVPLVVASVSEGGCVGRGEASGVYYLGETPESMVAQIETVRSDVEQGASRADLLQLLPCGGARNALDCALWELESKRAKTPVWKLAGVEAPRGVLTTRTIYAASPVVMAQDARELKSAPILKLKLLGDGEDAARVSAVRRASAEARLVVDANQGFEPRTFTTLLPHLVKAGVELIEQPFSRERDDWMDGIERVIPIAADESAQGVGSIAALSGRFDVINIKLDKCGGLTEALDVARIARAHGLGVMMGCMTSTSLAMAPAAIVAQLCDLADIDGPLYLARDRSPTVQYEDFRLIVGHGVWGHHD
jgi:L-Ala-D/L-Glu epimerase